MGDVDISYVLGSGLSMRFFTVTGLVVLLLLSVTWKLDQSIYQKLKSLRNTPFVPPLTSVKLCFTFTLYKS